MVIGGMGFHAWRASVGAGNGGGRTVASSRSQNAAAQSAIACGVHFTAIARLSRYLRPWRAGIVPGETTSILPSEALSVSTPDEPWP